MPHRTIVRYTRKSSRGTNRQRERTIQQALARWLRQDYPTIDFYFDWSSGAYLTAGQNRARLQYASNNDWVDLFIAEPSRGYCGLFLEVKTEDVRIYLKDGKTLTADAHIRRQADFLARQRQKGYCALFGRGLDACKDKINWYLNRRVVNTQLF